MGRIDVPPLAPRWSVADDEVAASLDERLGDATLTERGHRRLQDVSLGDAAEVEPHPGRESDRAPHAVDGELPPAHEGARRVQPGTGRKSPAVPRLAPERHEGPDGRVERAVAVARDSDGAGEHIEQLRTHRHFVARAPLEAPQLALGTIIAHLVLELGDPIEGGAGSISCRAR